MSCGYLVKMALRNCAWTCQSTGEAKLATGDGDDIREREADISKSSCNQSNLALSLDAAGRGRQKIFFSKIDLGKNRLLAKLPTCITHRHTTPHPR